MRPDILVIDADGRFEEVAGLVDGRAYEFGDNPGDAVDPRAIHEQLRRDMPQMRNIGTIGVDSMTVIMEPIIDAAMAAKAAGEVKSLGAQWAAKARAVRLIQSAITIWKTDILLIWHEEDARDNQGNARKRQTVSMTERARLIKSLNLLLKAGRSENGQLGVHVRWARGGRSDITLWDDTGCWGGMPERVDEAVWGDLTAEERAQFAEPPAYFKSVELAIAWGMEAGVFRDEAHVRNAYEKVKREAKPQNATQMRDAWVADVERRIMAAELGEEEE
jgi:hypothetical protein